MHLKALKLHGFKSFADPSTLRFEPGVTAVVGPNGCGKSNIADSIRWVLGEQSAKALRGGKMQDVIFEGADTRKPAQMCEVSLLLTDCEKQLGSEFHEIEIMRRVHRDGQSEYFFNGQPCRLKDIHKLFMDTGIGARTYSIIEHPAPITNHTATLKLDRITDGDRTYAVWTSEFDAPAEKAEEMAKGMGENVFQGGFNALKSHFLGQS